MKTLFSILILLSPIIGLAQIKETFESGEIAGWEQYPSLHWATTTNKPLKGNYSLQHNYNDSTAGKARISIAVENIDIQDATTSWRFLLRHGQKPSSNNFWAVFLMSNKNAEYMTKDSSINGYAIGVNLIGKDDTLRLYKLTNGIASKLITTDINWKQDIGTSGIAAIEVIREQNGKWQTKISKANNFDSLEISGMPAIDTEHSNFNYFGLLYTYTKTAIKKIWIDDISISSSKLPPKIVAVEKLSKNQLQIILSKGIKSIGNVAISNTNDEPVDIIEYKIDEQNKRKINIKTERLFGRKFNIAIENIIDENDIVQSLSHDFFIDNFDFGDVVINEIMFRPTPSVLLPDKKYIELYNRSPLDIYLKDWKILYGENGTAKIKSDTLAAHSYAIICATSAVDTLSLFGKTIAATNFPSLPYAGQSLRLIDYENTLIARCDYLPAWHSDEEKKAGGWSLEKIDFNNLSESGNNWKSSSDSKGGTPGQINSIFAENTDLEPPYITNWEILNNNELELIFNEAVNEQIAELTSTYNANNELGEPTQASCNYNTVRLTFAVDINIGRLYTLTISPNFEDYAGNKIENRELVFGKMQNTEHNDIVINELLFNPKSGGSTFVEIYNRSNKNLNLKDLFVTNRNKSNGALQNKYAISKTNYFFEPQHFIVLSVDPENIKQQYFVEKPEALIQVQKLPALPNSKGSIVLINNNEQIIDEFDYDEKMHFDFLKSTKGVSLERTNYDKPSNDPQNWHSASSDVGYATPSYKNSQAEYEAESYGFTVERQSFSPYGSNIDNELEIKYSLAESGYLANIKIYDAKGMWVCNLSNNALLGRSGNIRWNGNNHKHQKVKSGVYVIYIEYFNLQGQIFREKKTCVVGVKR